MKRTLPILILLSGFMPGCTNQIHFSGNPVYRALASLVVYRLKVATTLFITPDLRVTHVNKSPKDQPHEEMSGMSPEGPSGIDK